MNCRRDLERFPGHRVHRARSSGSSGTLLSSLPRVTPGRANQFIELRQESRAIGPGERGGSAAEFSGLTEHFEQGAGRQRITDGVLRELQPRRTQDPRPVLKAATRDEYASGANDVPRPAALGDPVVRDIESVAHTHELEDFLLRYA